MTKNEIKKITKVAENLGWSITIDENNISFQKYSPAGQDFNIEVTTDNLTNLSYELQERYENFDCSEEAYMWLDNTGHGRNGAPYDMKEVYEDMEACEGMLEELTNAIRDIL